MLLGFLYIFLFFIEERTMQVILLERVINLGFIGDVVTVKDGFARNFLIPTRKALRATKENMALFEARKSVIEADNLKKKKEAEAAASKMSGLCVNVIRQAGDSGRLFGSVRNADVSEAAKEAGFVINKSQVVIDSPIKSLGIYVVKVVLHPDVIMDLKVNVAQSEEEAEVQLSEQKDEKEV